MSHPQDAAIRRQLEKLLESEEAHAGFEAAVAGLSPAHRGTVPAGCEHSAWQLLEHLRLAQRDILDFCRDPAYRQPDFPGDYWPRSPRPPTDAAWDGSLRAFSEDRAAVKRMVSDPAVELLSPVPWGSGQTYLREYLLVADHNAYHVGQMVLLRRILGCWPGS